MTPNQAVTQNSPSASEANRIAAARSRISKRSARFEACVEKGKGKQRQIGPSHNDHAGWVSHLQDVFGTCGTAFPSVELNRLVLAAQNENGDVDQTRLNALVAFVEGTSPSTELEAAIACQLAVAHGLTMELLRRAERASQVPQFLAAGAIATKLMRAFAGQVEVLQKLKRGGEQTVRVEHVHIHPGANAMVGCVTGGGRGEQNYEHQPHAPVDAKARETRRLSASTCQPMPSLNETRDGMPIASGSRETAMPNARRREG